MKFPRKIGSAGDSFLSREAVSCSSQKNVNVSNTISAHARFAILTFRFAAVLTTECPEPAAKLQMLWSQQESLECDHSRVRMPPERRSRLAQYVSTTEAIAVYPLHHGEVPSGGGLKESLDRPRAFVRKGRL